MLLRATPLVPQLKCLAWTFQRQQTSLELWVRPLACCLFRSARQMVARIFL